MTEPQIQTEGVGVVQGAFDNSYKATFGDAGWGAKAQERLGQVSIASSEQGWLCARAAGALASSIMLQHVQHVQAQRWAQFSIQGKDLLCCLPRCRTIVSLIHYF